MAARNHAHPNLEWLPAAPGAVAVAPGGSAGPESIAPPRELPDAVVKSEAMAPEALPLPSVHEADVIGAAPQDPLMPRVVESPRLPVVLPLKDIDLANHRRKLDRELQEGEAKRVELFCADTARVFARVRTVLGGKHAFHVDAVVEERLKKKQPTQLAIFSDTLTPAELVELLQAIAKEEPTVGTMVLSAFQRDDQSELAQLLGVAANQVFKYKPAVTGQRPFSETTPEQLAAQLARRNATSPAPAKSPDRAVLVVPYQLGRPNPLASTAVKSFLEQRREPKGDTLPILLILRTNA